MEYICWVTIAVLAVDRGWMCSGDIRINEINADNPLQDTEEFLELWNPDSCRRSLNGYTLIFFSGVRAPVTAYRTIDLSGHCISENGYITIGSSSLNPRPDLIDFVSDGIQNGRGEADAVALYNNYFVPTTITDLHLVDLVIYDKDLETSIANYPDNPIFQQTPVREDEGFLSDDESINRCQLPALSHSSFGLGRITPGAPNFCQPLGSTTTDCYDSSLANNVRFTIRAESKIDSAYFMSQAVRSSNECATQCSQIQACAMFSFNVKNSTPENCLFFFSCDDVVIGDQDWHVGTRLQ